MELLVDILENKRKYFLEQEKFEVALGLAIALECVDNILPGIILEAKEESTEDAYDEGYDDGYHEGYHEGFRDGADELED